MIINKAKPFFSVIIPAYNRRVLLTQAVESALAQSFNDYEIIIIDDGSTEEQPSFDGLPVSYQKREHCGLAGVVRNAGANLAGGSYLAFLDSDDLWLPNKLEKQYKQIQQSDDNTAIFHCREEWRRSDKVISQASQKHRHAGDIFADALIKCIVGPSTMVVKTELFRRAGGFSQLEVAEDYELCLKLLSYGPAAYIDEPLVIKRAGFGDHLSEKYNEIESFRIEALSRLYYHFDFNYLHKTLLYNELCRKLAIYIAGCFKRGLYDKAKQNLAKLNELALNIQ